MSDRPGGWTLTSPHSLFSRLHLELRLIVMTVSDTRSCQSGEVSSCPEKSFVKSHVSVAVRDQSEAVLIKGETAPLGPILVLKGRTLPRLQKDQQMENKWCGSNRARSWSLDGICITELLQTQRRNVTVQMELSADMSVQRGGPSDNMCLRACQQYTHTRGRDTSSCQL